MLPRFFDRREVVSDARIISPLSSMRNRSILFIPILILALSVRPVFGSDKLSPENAQALVGSLKEADELWKKPHRDAAILLSKYEHLLPEIERAFGKDSPQVGGALFRIGFLYTLRGDHERAVSNLERSLKLVSPLRENSENLVMKANLYWGLGMSYKSLLQFERAIQAFNESLKLKEKLLGSDDQSLVEILS